MRSLLSAPNPPSLGLDRLLPFWTATFGVPASVFTGVWAAVPEGRRQGFAVVRDGRIEATVQVYVLPLNGADVGCVANVATRESARKRGLSTALLGEAIRWMGANGIELSYLFTGVPEHYARLGWKATSERVRRISSDAAPLAPGAPDLDRMAALYAVAPPPFAMLRDATWWREVVVPRLAEKLVWTAPDAYLVASSGNALAIEEAVGDPDGLRRLVLGATAWAGGRAVLHGDLDLGTPDERTGGMLRGGTMPANAWTSALDHF